MRTQVLSLIVGIPLFSFLTGCGGTVVQTRPLADEAQTEEALQFRFDPDYATVYFVRPYNGFNFYRQDLYVDDQLTGELWDNQFVAFKATPGVHTFRVNKVSEYPEVESYNGSGYMPEFELDLPAGSVAKLSCGNNGVNHWNDSPDEKLLLAPEECADGRRQLSTNSEGVTFCSRPWKGLEVIDRNFLLEPIYDPAGFENCKLTELDHYFSYADMVVADIELIQSSGTDAFAEAKEVNSSAAYQTFINQNPRSDFVAEARALYDQAVVREQEQAWENQITSILERDSALPLQAQRDKYIIALTGYLQNQDFEPSLLYFELLDRMNIELSDSLTHFWGEALLRTGQPAAAIEKFYEYINATGASGTYYRDSLALINEAEAL